MKTVMAQGTFDILHPGHLYYLKESKKEGDKLVVVIARDSRVNGKELFFSEDERQEMVDSLDLVDRAILGSEGDIYSTVEKINPDVVTLGYDQDHDLEEVKELAEEATGHEVEVTKIGQKEGYSSSDIRG